MQIDDAISRIGEIHDHLTRTEVYRGYRAVPVALSGVLAFAGAILQPTVGSSGDLADQYGEYVIFWVALAAASAALAAVGIVGRYWRDSALGRRQARKVVGQFLPAMAAGALLTGVVWWLHRESTPLLPGLWSTTFALGIFASRPYLPRAIGWVGLFYLAAGAGLLALAGWPDTGDAASLKPWAMGATFGPGQLASAAVLWWKVERRDDVGAPNGSRSGSR